MVVTSTVADALPIADASREKLNRHTGNFIDGEIRPAVSGKTMPVIEPSTGETVAEASDSGPRDVDIAATAARAAFDDGRWRTLPPFQKEAVLRRFAELVRANREVFMDLDIVDNGMPRVVAEYHVMLQDEVLNYYAGWPSKLDGTVHPSDDGVLVFTKKNPVGVVAAIVPWNGPATSALWKVAPALAAGNSVVLKPAEQTPMSGLFLAELAIEAGVPPGVFNVVQGAGAVAGAALVEHRAIDKITFTGSTATGQAILHAAAASFKRVTLELGGKSPNIVFADADLEAAAQGALATAWANSGQTCISGSRLLVERSAHDALLDKLITYTKAGITLGNGFDPNTTMGPLISAQQLDRVCGYIELGKREGASLALGGDRWGDRGYFVNPTIFAGVRNDMRIAREEIFGPVLSVIPFDTEEEAFAIGNDTDYGLGGALWTRDVDRALRGAAAIHAGTVWVNTYAELQSNVGFGGVRQSGLGRELGAGGIDAMTETKTVYMRHR